MGFSANEVLAILESNAKPFNKLTSFSESPGIYAVFLFGPAHAWPLAADAARYGDLLYIGKTESSQLERDLNQHFASGQTGRSTLRRTLGALLRDDLQLRPLPRSFTEASDRKYRNYKFDNQGEAELSVWMRHSLGLSFYEYGRPPKEIRCLERALIQLATPILNLNNNPRNTSLRLIKLARKECAKLAKLNDGGTEDRRSDQC